MYKYAHVCHEKRDLRNANPFEVSSSVVVTVFGTVERPTIQSGGYHATILPDMSFYSAITDLASHLTVQTSGK
ncbi:MAG: hypothetical protein AAGH92_12460, partial [Planctomycetota bacterium]